MASQAQACDHAWIFHDCIFTIQKERSLNASRNDKFKSGARFD
jgi:hypothetical protein